VSVERRTSSVERFCAARSTLNVQRSPFNVPCFGTRLPSLAAVFVILCLRAFAAPDTDRVLGSWLAASSNLLTLRATVVQTRHLKAFTQPLVSTGQVWFAAPNRFRWELGSPPQSIALRADDALVVLSPRLRRAERYPLGAGAGGPAKDLMDLLDVGFPRDAREFRTRFELLDVSTNTSALVLRMRPQSPAARKMMPLLSVDLDPAAFVLRATEMSFADGSRLRSDFSDVVTNAPVSEELFRTNLDSSWKLSTGGKSP